MGTIRSLKSPNSMFAVWAMFFAAGCSSDVPNAAPSADESPQDAFTAQDKDLVIEWARRLRTAIDSEQTLLGNTPKALSEDWPNWEAEVCNLPHAEDVFLDLLATKDNRVDPLIILYVLDSVVTGKSVPLLNSLYREFDTRAHDLVVGIVLKHSWPEATNLLWSIFDSASGNYQIRRIKAAEDLVRLRADGLVDRLERRLAEIEVEAAQMRTLAALAKGAPAQETADMGRHAAEELQAILFSASGNQTYRIMAAETLLRSHAADGEQTKQLVDTFKFRLTQIEKEGAEMKRLVALAEEASAAIPNGIPNKAVDRPRESERSPQPTTTNGGVSANAQ